MPEDDNSQRSVVIYIDADQYRVDRKRLTAAELRQLRTPAVPPTFDLFELRESGEDDRYLAPEDEIDLTEGARFFTAPAAITAGDSLAQTSTGRCPVPQLQLR